MFVRVRVHACVRVCESRSVCTCSFKYNINVYHIRVKEVYLRRLITFNVVVLTWLGLCGYVQNLFISDTYCM